MRGEGPLLSRLRLGASSLLLAGVLLVLSAPVAAAKPGAYKVLFANATDGPGGCGSGSPTLQGQVASEPGVASVNTFDASIATPSTALLDQYDMVVTISDCNAYANGAAMGDNLAGYADQGGVVVEYPYGMESRTGYELTGRWLSGGYSPFVPGSNPNNDVTLASFDASSPLMAGVRNLGSTGSPACDTTGKLASGATSVALWNTGQHAVAYKKQVVGVNAGVDGSCTFSGDFARLTVNAVRWRGRHYLTVKKTGTGKGAVKSSPTGIRCGKTCSAIYNFAKTVKLTAKAKTGSTFARWSGACHGKKKTCKVTMSATKHVKARFVARS